MTVEKHDIVIIGGGSAGIAAAISAYNNGCKDILLLEKDAELGGILLQCIHNGFGLHRFGEELAGPAYAEKWTNMLKDTSVKVKLNTTVIHLIIQIKVLIRISQLHGSTDIVVFTRRFYGTGLFFTAYRTGSDLLAKFCAGRGFSDIPFAKTMKLSRFAVAHTVLTVFLFILVFVKRCILI